jgi:hypothetical protein
MYFVATGGGEGERADPNDRIERGGKINKLNENFDFLPSTNPKLLSQMKGKSINDCDFL